MAHPVELKFTEFQHTAARRRLPHCGPADAADADGFNTQPPEGGCLKPEEIQQRYTVSTHSRPKAAAFLRDVYDLWLEVSTHSRPKAAAPCLKTLLKSDN